MKSLSSWLRSFALDTAFHAAAWMAVLVSIYFSFTYSKWWPIAVALAVVLLIDVLLIFRRVRRKTHSQVQEQRQVSNDQ